MAHDVRLRTTHAATDYVVNHHGGYIMTLVSHLSLYITPDPDAMARQAAELIIERCAAAVAAHDAFTIALSGGSTPVPLFRLLAGQEYADRIPWNKVSVYWVDERCVHPDHEQSNYRVARDELLHKVDATKFYRMKGEAQPEIAAQAYEELLRRQFGLSAGELPRFDCVLLGTGADGHTASLFPHSTGLEEREKLVIDQYVPSLHSTRLTLTLPVINNARDVIVMASGHAKHPVLAKALNLLEPRLLPIQHIAPAAGRLSWVIDQAAAQPAA